MPATKIRDLLDRERIKYVSIRHSAAFTAQEIAASTHISGRDFAKTVIAKVDGRLVMVVLPANRKVMLGELRELLGADRAELATEEEFRSRFPDCELGAMPPFGNLYGMDTVVAPNLAEEEEIAFNAGTHTEVIRMAYADFSRVVRPRVVACTT